LIYRASLATKNPEEDHALLKLGDRPRAIKRPIAPVAYALMAGKCRPPGWIPNRPSLGYVKRSVNDVRKPDAIEYLNNPTRVAIENSMPSNSAMAQYCAIEQTQINK